MLVGMGGVLGIKDDSFLYGARCVTGAAFGTPRLVGFTHDLLIVARQVVLSVSEPAEMFRWTCVREFF